MNREFPRSDLAKTALAAKQPEKAKKYAEEMLAGGGAGWNHGNTVHRGNLILGRIALKAGDMEKAKEHLLAAGRTPGSPQLNSFGPNMVLARELLAQGEREVVLEYFELCSKFWKREELTEWTKTVQEGGTPHFGANMRY